MTQQRGGAPLPTHERHRTRLAVAVIASHAVACHRRTQRRAIAVVAAADSALRRESAAVLAERVRPRAPEGRGLRRGLRGRPTAPSRPQPFAVSGRRGWCAINGRKERE